MRQRAFSLIEVIVAAAIFAMAATALMSAFVNALLAREQARQNDQLHADIRAVRLQLILEPDIELAQDGGEYPTLHHGEAIWEASIEPTEVVDLFRVDFLVRLTDPPEGEAFDHQETLFLLRPTWSESDERSDLLQDKKEALEDARRAYNF